MPLESLHVWLELLIVGIQCNGFLCKLHTSSVRNVAGRRIWTRLLCRLHIIKANCICVWWAQLSALDTTNSTTLIISCVGNFTIIWCDGEVLMPLLDLQRSAEVTAPLSSTAIRPAVWGLTQTVRIYQRRRNDMISR